jgi:murein DD-endopeptidase MepM/ murein hydrolase activator NlpD
MRGAGRCVRLLIGVSLFAALMPLSISATVAPPIRDSPPTIFAAQTDGFDFPVDPKTSPTIDQRPPSYTAFNVKNSNLRTYVSCFDTGWYNLQHTGEDWFRDQNSPVYAVANGHVVYSGNQNYPGAVVIIEHTLPSGVTNPWGGNTIYSMYAHLNLNDLIAVNTDVSRGQKIGSVFPQYTNGQPNFHIHFEIRRYKFMSDAPPVSGYSKNCIGDSPKHSVAGAGYSWANADPALWGYMNPSGWIDGHRTISGGNSSQVILNISWGYDANTYDWGYGMSRNRSVLFELRQPDAASDVLTTRFTTDGNGVLNGLQLTNVLANTYDLYLKPNGFLRYRVRQHLNPGVNNVFFPMTRPGTHTCQNGTATTSGLWGDIDGNNVLNMADFNLMVKYSRSGQTPLPPGIADVDGNNLIDPIDINGWARSMCFFGAGNPPVVYGDGGREDRNLNLVGTSLNIASDVTNIAPQTTPNGATTVYTDAPNAHLFETTAFHVYVDTAGVQVDGADVVVRYDPQYLAVASVAKTTTFPVTYVLSNNALTGEVNISVGALQNNPIAAAGDVADIQFQAVGQGQTTVSVDFVPTSRGRSGLWQNQTGAQVQGYVGNQDFEVLAPVVSISPSNFDFGAVDTSGAQNVLLTNTGTDPLHVTGISFSGDNPGDFSTTTDTCTAATVAPGGSCTVNVQFVPTASGTRTVDMAFQDDAGYGPQVITLVGLGKPKVSAPPRPGPVLLPPAVPAPLPPSLGGPIAPGTPSNLPVPRP